VTEIRQEDEVLTADDQEPWSGVPLLKQLMAERGLSAPKLATAAGLGQDYVRNVLRGRSRDPRYENLKSIAKVLGVTVGVLTGDEPPPPPPTRVVVKRPRGSMLTSRESFDERADDEVRAEVRLARGFVSVPVVELRGGAGPHVESLPPIAHLTLPAGPISVAGSSADDVIAIQAPGLGLPPDVPAGAWLLVDTSRRELSKGLLRGRSPHLVHDGSDFVLGRLFVMEGTLHGIVGEGQQVEGVPVEEIRIVGKVIAVIRNL
jgi:transcriptional regulator with XRE-family HTH domain